jgi:hypothetical protein
MYSLNSWPERWVDLFHDGPMYSLNLLPERWVDFVMMPYFLKSWLEESRTYSWPERWVDFIHDCHTLWTRGLRGELDSFMMDQCTGTGTLWAYSQRGELTSYMIAILFELVVREVSWPHSWWTNVLFLTYSQRGEFTSFMMDQCNLFNL